MNKKGFIDLDEINLWAVALGLAGGIFAFWITGNPFGMGGEENAVNNVSMFWRIGSGVLTTIVGFLVVQKMAE